MFYVFLWYLNKAIINTNNKMLFEIIMPLLEETIQQYMILKKKSST